jgi:iron complex outermembrane receptor protein
VHDVSTKYPFGMKSFFIRLIILFVSLHTYQLISAQTKVSKAPGSLSGRIWDKKSNTPLPNASIFIPDLQMGTAADDSGHYAFKKLPQGTYLVEVHYIGFKAQTRSINITGNVNHQDFALTDEVVEEGTVVITGTSKATQIKRSPVPIVAVNHTYLVTNLSSNIIDAIAKVPGVSALTTGPNVSKPFIRGLGYNRILTLFDGVRQEGQQWGDEHGIEVDQYGVDRIEVIKGPASLSYGSDALAGVVNLIPTPQPQDGKIKGEVQAEYQTNNGMFGGTAMLSGNKNGFEWMGRVSHKEATNYRNKIDGRVFNTGFKETDGTIAMGLHGKWGFTHLNLSMFDDLQEIPDGSRDSATGKFTKQITEDDLYRPIVTDDELKSYAITTLHQHVQHYRGYLNNNFILGNNGRLGVNLGFQRSVRREFNHPEQPYQDVAGLYLQMNTYSYDVKYYLPEIHGWNFTTGVNGMYQENDVTKGTEFVIPSYHQFDVGPFALIKKTFSRLDIAGGVRYDARSFNNSALYTSPDPVSGFEKPVYGADTVGAANPFHNYKHTFTGFSGSVGATYNVSEKFALKANISRGYRAPNISEISANGVHPGTNIYQVGNDQFKPEFSLQEDLGLSYTSKYIIINFSVFNNTISNYIFNQKLAAVGGGDSLLNGNSVYKFQQGKANLYGGELSVDFHPIKPLHFENSVSVVYGDNKNVSGAMKTDSNKYLPFVPPLHGISELRYDFDGKAHHIVDGFAKVQLAYYAKQDRVYLTDNTESATPGYALVNAGVGAGFTNRKGRTMFNVYLMANNIFDVAYWDHLNRLKYFLYSATDTNPTHGIHNMGRNFSFKINVPLEWKY